MTTPAGQIKASDIVSEFGSSSGSSNNISMGAYRVSQTIAGRSWSLDEGVPSSGSIAFSQLRGKTLNVVVDYGTSTLYRVDASTKYSDGVVVGGFKSRPGINIGSKKVVNVIRGSIGAESDETGKATALRTGNGWNSETLLKFIITSTGLVSGAGGRGGNCNQLGTNAGDGVNIRDGLPVESGKPGSHAFGASFNCDVVIENSGILQCGFGGGGAGGTIYVNPNDSNIDPWASGGGGGGGQGLPGGIGGVRFESTAGYGFRIRDVTGARIASPSAGTGNEFSGGNGGQSDGGGASGANLDGGGGGGGGGSVSGVGGESKSPYESYGTTLWGQNGTLLGGGSGGSAWTSYTANENRVGRCSFGTGGSNGSAIIRSGSSITVTLQNSGTLFGETNTVGTYT